MFLTMQGVLHCKRDVDMVYLSRKIGERGLISCEGSIRMKENNLRWYVRNSNEPLTERVKAAETIEYNNTVNKREFKQSLMREKKELWKNKRRHGHFVRKMPETTDEKETWSWLRKADLKVGMEAMLCTVQEQAVRTN